jgi:Raf kinase inhibitor-like YbhB/YbcL family protein
MQEKNIVNVFILFTASLILSGAGSVAKEPSAFKLRSLSFSDFQTIPARFSFNMKPQCSGDNYSPSLSWIGAPPGTKSFSIIMHDPDGGNWIHWVQFNIPSNVNMLDEAKGGPDIGIKGTNSFGGMGYAGPCPPFDGKVHRYIFTLYALDSGLAIHSGTTRDYLQKAMKGHVIGQATLTGLKKGD